MTDHRYRTWLGVLLFTVLFMPGCTSTRDLEAEEKEEGDQVDIGYGTIDRKDVTTSVSSIRPDERQTVVTMAQLLQSRVPGMVVTETPDGGVSIRIRGAKSFHGNDEPLIVLDGVPLTDARSLNWVNPQDVASIEVLKDAGSTAIYGTRGANGVLLIKTKR